MAVTINSNGTITGIAVGGLPDGVVDAGTLATNSVDSAELIDGAVDNSHLATGVDAAKVTTGTLPMARLSGTLPALNGSALTNLPASTSVAFPATQVASADANTLDDYEEGVWTIGQTFSSGSATIGTNVGHYTKIGRLVAIQGYFGVGTPSSPSGTWTITGLPFTMLSGPTVYFYVTLWNTLPSATGSGFFAQYSGGTSFPFWEATNSTTRGADAGAYANHGTNNSPYVGFQFTYLTAS